MNEIKIEKIVLNSMIILKVPREQGISCLRKEMFLSQYHGEIFDGIKELESKNISVEIVTLINYLKTKKNMIVSQKILEEELINIFGDTDSASITSIVNLCEIMKEAFIKRELGKIGQSIIGRVSDKETTSTEILPLIDKAISDLLLKYQTQNDEPKHISEYISEYYEEIDNCRNSIRKQIKIGIKPIDENGFFAGEVMILAARPSMGKTALALNMAKTCAMNGDNVMIFSLEMSGISLFRRMLASVSEINLKSLRFGTIAKNQMDRLIESSEMIQKLPIYIHDKSNISIYDIHSIASRYKRKIGLGLIIIDYVQLIKDSSNKEKRLEVAENSKFIKSMSKSLGVPIIILSQLSRNCESRSDKRPVLSDLSESSSLEADADIVAFVHREYRYDKSAPENLAEFIVGKYRDGEIGNHLMKFEGDIQRFLAMEEHEENEMKEKMNQSKNSKDKNFVW